VIDPPAGSAIELTNASRWYGNVVAVNDVSFRLDGGVTGLLGPNGAGKSTILHMTAGFLATSSGSVAVGGQPSWRRPEMYRSIGLVPEREAVYPFLSGRQFVRANALLQGMSSADAEAATARAIGQVELADAQDRQIGTYSKGMRQRAKVAAALVHEPPILLLDEPFNGMDPRQRLHMMDLLRRMAAEGRTILFSSHILEEVERVAERVLVIVAGRLAASGDFREIRRLMTDRPHTFTVRSSDDRALAAALLREPTIGGVELSDGLLTVRTADFGAFSRAVAGVARRAGIRLHELRPTDESLESVFSYLVRR
jgi:ABC-2 type transport system ATP-binding protein